MGQCWDKLCYGRAGTCRAGVPAEPAPLWDPVVHAGQADLRQGPVLRPCPSGNGRTVTGSMASVRSPEAMPIRKRRSGHWEYGLCPQDLVLSPGVCQVVFKNHTVRVMRVKCPFIPEKPREVPLGKKNFKVLLSKTSPFREPRSFTCKWKGQANVWGGGPSLANRPRAVNLSGPSMTFHWLMAWASLVALTKLGRFSVSRKIEHT